MRAPQGAAPAAPPPKRWSRLGGDVVVQRVTAGNAGPMTAGGTNTYIVAQPGGGPAAVIDPGPDAPEHREAVLAVAGGPSAVAAILATHTHLDHTAGAAALARVTGALIYAFGAHGAGARPAHARFIETLQASGADLGGGEGGDLAFQPSRTLQHSQSVGAPGAAWRLRALFTPGHTTTHLCFALEAAAGPGDGLVFSGDHVMGWATSLVSPPDGDMVSYMLSLAALSARRDDLFLPGHGYEVTDPAARLAELTAHRRSRRAAILAAISDEARRVREVRALVYEGLQPALAPMAERNVLAHLLQLMEENRARSIDPLSAEARFIAL